FLHCGRLDGTNGTTGHALNSQPDFAFSAARHCGNLPLRGIDLDLVGRPGHKARCRSLDRVADPQGDPADRCGGRHRLGAVSGVLGTLDRRRARAARVRGLAGGVCAHLAARAAGRRDRACRPVVDEPPRQFDDERSRVAPGVEAGTAATAAAPAPTGAAATGAAAARATAISLAVGHWQSERKEGYTGRMKRLSLALAITGALALGASQTAAFAAEIGAYEAALGRIARHHGRLIKRVAVHRC